MNLQSLRERKKTATKERLFREALNLFREKGFAATTVDEVAAAAEVSKGTFFNYFPTKEAVLSYLGERQTAQTADSLREVVQHPGLSARDKFRRVLHILAENLQADRELTRVAVFEAMKLPNVLAGDLYRPLFRNLLSALAAEAQKSGEIRREVSPDLAAAAISGIYFQQVFEWCAAEKPFDLRRRLDEMLALLWEGIGG